MLQAAVWQINVNNTNHTQSALPIGFHRNQNTSFKWILKILLFFFFRRVRNEADKNAVFTIQFDFSRWPAIPTLSALNRPRKHCDNLKKECKSKGKKPWANIFGLASSFGPIISWVHESVLMSDKGKYVFDELLKRYQRKNEQI